MLRALSVLHNVAPMAITARAFSCQFVYINVSLSSVYVFVGAEVVGEPGVIVPSGLTDGAPVKPKASVPMVQ